MAACTLDQLKDFASLVQIRHTYAAECCGLQLLVKSDQEGWKAEVYEAGHGVYSARRCSLRSAKIAAAEFALWSAGAALQKSPETLAQQLSWQDGW